jgi:hypothetical protein
MAETKEKKKIKKLGISKATPSTLVKSDKSPDKQFQYAIWEKGGHFFIHIKRFWRQSNGVLNWNKFDQMSFKPMEFEYFKRWIKTIKKKK